MEGASDDERMIPELGIIEGYYGVPWSWQEREETATYLAQHGYRFYLYAPKADPHLRRLWRELHPADVADNIRSLAARCRERGVRFGIGLSPSKVHVDFNDDARAVLARKLASLDDLGIQDFALLFDDMRGDTPDLAEKQAEIVHWAFERVKADRFFVCPSYYTNDPVLDRVFGERPRNYVSRIGELLDPSIQIFWTGEEVLSKEILPGHLQRVTEQLRRKPFLWDNYPVNDGERMSQHLHVRAFTGRPASIARHIAGHGINPALQPTLARIPALTLLRSYQLGDAYEYLGATREAAVKVLGEQLGTQLCWDLHQLQDYGLDRLKPDVLASLREKYATYETPGAREIVAWFDGAYRITDEIIHEQSGDA